MTPIFKNNIPSQIKSGEIYQKYRDFPPFCLYVGNGWSSPRCTMMFPHFVLLRSASHNFPGFLYRRSKLLIKVKRWAPLARFHGILPLKARSSSFPFRKTCPKILSCLCSIQQSSLHSCPNIWGTYTLVWSAVHGTQRILR